MKRHLEEESNGPYGGPD
jgi:hypothetical protein